tara:strand:- start:1687 stop:2094 length:408 start_codon:yes stop_codon:yes gene_type:complete
MKNSIKPSIWGPHGWKFLHYVSMGYPNSPSYEDKSNYKNFYHSLQYVLPCEKCAMNYKQNLRKLPIDNNLESRDSLVKWVIDIHNLVNDELGKDKVDYEKALSLYTNEESKLVDHCFKLAVLIIILYFLYLILKK